MPQHDTGLSQAVHRFLALDFTRKEELQEIVELASASCCTPLAMITLLDEHTEHTIFSAGTEIKQQQRKETFCQYLLKGEEIMVVTDALVDSRFSTCKLVVEEPGVRFYAGVPLITKDGYMVGSLCVMGMIVKQLTDAQKHLLKVLSKWVVERMELELRFQSHELHQPVAFILGLMNVIKISDYSTGKEELMMLSSAADDLDVKIRTIIALAE